VGSASGRVGHLGSGQAAKALLVISEILFRRDEIPINYYRTLLRAITINQDSQHKLVLSAIFYSATMT
jgi:hypothetical protein